MLFRHCDFFHSSQVSWDDEVITVNSIFLNKTKYEEDEFECLSSHPWYNKSWKYIITNSSPR